jgi:hypothetical protein
MPAAGQTAVVHVTAPIMMRVPPPAITLRIIGNNPYLRVLILAASLVTLWAALYAT